MNLSLLKPQILACKNRVHSECKKSIFNRELLAFIISIFLLYAIYHGTYSLLFEMKKQSAFSFELAASLLHICLIAFFLLLLFSSCIAALNYFYTAKDLQLLFTTPISQHEFFLSRIILISCNAGWMFLLFGIPSLIGYAHALELDPLFYLVGIATFIPFILIPVLIATCGIIILIGLVPAHKLRDVLILLAFCGIGAILYFSPAQQAYISTEEAKVNDLLVYLESANPPDFKGSPVKLARDIYYLAISGDYQTMLQPIAGLLGTFATLYICAFLIFKRLHPRGWNSTIQSGPAMRVYDSPISRALGQLLFFRNPQLRAMAGKEWRLFVRDTTQSLQLLLLLTLTFVYLFNFRALRQGSHFSEQTFELWHVLLSIANISFGTCVVSAIATRFVYPSISLEGRAYSLLRNSPLSLEQLLRHKFRIWYFPIAFICTLLLVSGTWAIQAPVAAIVATAIISLALSVSIVGLGVGIGAVYARFDWENQAQVTASFGSLVFMLLALGTICISTIPTLFIFVLTCIPSFKHQLQREHYLFVLTLSYFLVFVINWAVAKRALSAGAHRLREMER